MKYFLKKQNTLFLLLFTMLTFSQCAGNIDDQLKKIAQEANAQCPKMLDQWTRLDSCAVYPGKKYTYYHSVINDAKITDTTLFKTNLKPQIISIVRTNPDMKFFRDNDVTLNYRYNDEKGNYIFSITATPEEYKK
ncbi:MAG: hypothetical protein LBV43_08320 [Prevotella sp.]|jgi:hypothetical protein|nr:hypothetical protein [Prevotella sp.]